jgi:sulfate adenylyltransferase subunit 1 (EFTu-like GTPase family)
VRRIPVNRTTGGFNIINETTNHTVAAGMILDTD